MPTLTLSGAFDTSELPKLAPEPVTITVSRRVVTGCEASFEDLAGEIVAAVEDFPGSLGAGVLRPGADGGEYHIVFRFVDAISLRAWERSEVRAELLGRTDGMVLDTRVQRTVGVDTWFELPSRAEPKRRFMTHVLTDVAWAFPVVFGASLYIGPKLLRLPIELRTLASMTIVTVVMRLGVGPMRGALRRRRRLG